jgi:electron transfer flavoprotein alpha subunit
MARIFAYIEHKGGVADDSAAELVAAAKKIDPAASPTAVVTGWGADLDAVCKSLTTSYAEVWKVANEALAYPNGELVRKALAKVVPHDSLVLVPHDHFGVDLAPGLSIQMNSTFVSDVVAIEGLDGAFLKVVRQEYGGQFAATFPPVRSSTFGPDHSSPSRVLRRTGRWSTNPRRSAP